MVIIPLETDEALERLKHHMLSDSQPDGEKLAEDEHCRAECHYNYYQKTGSCFGQSCNQLVDFVQLVKDAWTSRCIYLERNPMADLSLILEQLFPPEIRNDALDSLQYSHSIFGCFDVAKLVALGLVRHTRNEFSPFYKPSVKSPPGKRHYIRSLFCF